MGSERRNDKSNKGHETIPAYGVPATDESLNQPDGPSQESTADRSPAPIPSSVSEPLAELPSVIEPGVVLLNKYRVLEEIGRGGMSSVWLVEHLHLGEKRALKVIHALVADDPQVRARFEQEAKILAKLKHPNAVIVYDTGIAGRVPYIEMEYLEGKTLRHLLNSTPGKPVKIGTIDWVLKEICDVLARAHALGIVHRDLKPENIMIIQEPLSGSPQLKVLDFGIAKIVQEEGNGSGVTLDTKGLLGTPAYSSPEQNDFDPQTNHRMAIDRRSDIYSLGVMLFEMLTGHRPFEGSRDQLLDQQARVDPPRFKEVAPELRIATEIEAVVRRCLEKKPDNRPKSAAELYDEFRRSAKPGWWTRRRIATFGLFLLLVPLVWFDWKHRQGWSNWKPPPPPVPPPVPDEVMKYLAQAGFQPAENEKIDKDGWPSVIVQSAGERRNLFRHSRLYLPQGYEPESEGTDEGFPRVVKSPYGVRFIRIPGGPYMMGAFDKTDTFIQDERPPHRVELTTFYLQENEVTIEEFDRFCKETIRGPNDPELRHYYEVRNLILGATSEETCRKYPASGVSHKLAVLYAHWVGGELPSEAQWEYAARSRGKRVLYVWGNDPGVAPGNRKANLDNNLAGNKINTCEVGIWSGDRTDQGIHDMAGNVREWCRDVWKPYTDTGSFFNPVQGAADGEKNSLYVIRGGSYDTLVDMARVTYRSDQNNKEYKAPENESFEDVGFRVVLEVFEITPLMVSGSTKSGKAQESFR